jgi:hypothetical protein
MSHAHTAGSDRPGDGIACSNWFAVPVVIGEGQGRALELGAHSPVTTSGARRAPGNPGGPPQGQALWAGMNERRWLFPA